jgi:DNA repair protein RadC
MDLAETSEPTPSGPRERALTEGVAVLGDAELLAILLGTGLAGRPVTVVSAALLDRAGGLANLARLAPAAIAEHPGVGTIKALRLAAALELGARAARPALRVRLCNSAEVAAAMAPRLAALPHEEMWLCCLDGRNRLRGARRVAQGGLHGAAVQPRDVLRAAVVEAASAMILVHNHPGGDPTPSAEDVALTRRLAEAGEVVGVPLVDHVIVEPGGRYTSLLDLGVLTIP